VLTTLDRGIVGNTLVVQKLSWVGIVGQTDEKGLYLREIARIAVGTGISVGLPGTNP
jgi:hypothetical protein